MTAKYASTGSVFGQLVRDPQFWAPAIAMGAGVAATGAATAIQKLTDARRQATSFKEMLEIHPQLKTRDQTFVKRIYSSLNNVNPTMARDPMVAGAWVDTIIESGGLDQGAAARALLEGVKDLAQIRSHISQAKQRETSVPKAFGAAVTRQVEHGFGRGDAIHREQGDLAVAHQQIKDIQESHQKERIEERQGRAQKDIARAFGDAAARLSRTGITPQQTQSIVDSVIAKHSSDTSPGKRLIAACSR